MPGVRMDSSHRDLTDHYIRIPRSSTAQQGGNIDAMNGYTTGVQVFAMTT